jgi:hypothetical protein
LDKNQKVKKRDFSKDFIKSKGSTHTRNTLFGILGPPNRPFSTGQLSAFIIQLVTWQVLPRSERKNKISCNKNAIKNTEMLENYIYCKTSACDQGRIQ